jgi:6-phosphogluconolactonase
MEKHHHLLRFTPQTWALESSKYIQERVENCLIRNGECSVMLTGGGSANKLYKEWNMVSGFKNLSEVKFFLGDERCVPSDDKCSNYESIIKNLFPNGVQDGCAFYKMYEDVEGLAYSIKRYELLLPDFIDILLLTAGDDGHIASIFPDSPILSNEKNKVGSADAPVGPQRRITITRKVIGGAKEIIVLAPGKNKAIIRNIALAHPSNYFELPVRLALEGIWLVD